MLDAQTENSDAAPDAELGARWAPYTHLTLDRLPLPYWASAFLLGALVLVEQVMEQSLLGPVSSFLAPANLGLGLALPLLTVYMLLAHKTLKTSALRPLAQLRPTAQIDDFTYDKLVRRIIHTSPRAEALALLAALLIVVSWFVALRLPYPMIAAVRLPANPLQALLTLAAYTVFGWSGLVLVFSTWRFGRGLGQLTAQPLAINALDPDNVLPLGKLSLRHSLTVAVTVLLLVILMGAPGDAVEAGIIALATIASLSALVFPLWGVHRQMGQARDQVTARISQELAGCQSKLMACAELDKETLGELAERVEKLGELRTAVYRSPTWPFRNASSVVRVLLAAMSPLLYFILNEIIRTYLLPVFGVR